MNEYNEVSFEEALKENMPFILSPGCKTQISGYFTNFRVDRDTVPEGWYVYDFRTTGCGNICSIEPRVVVNHGGCFLTKQEVPMPKGYRTLAGRGGYTFA